MHVAALFSLLLSSIYLPSPIDASDCSCADKSLCKAINVGPRQEVYGFSTQTENWHQWDWNKLTTVSIFGKWDEDLLCHAHSKAMIFFH